jgi:mRNA interferase HigB
MRIVARSRLREFWERQPDAEESLRSWCKVAEHARWRTPGDVKASFREADVLRNGRVVFNIREDRFRLVVKLHYNTGFAYVRFIGTHKEYDKIDADTI